MKLNIINVSFICVLLVLTIQVISVKVNNSENNVECINNILLINNNTIPVNCENINDGIKIIKQ